MCEGKGWVGEGPKGYGEVGCMVRLAVHAWCLGAGIRTRRLRIHRATPHCDTHQDGSARRPSKGPRSAYEMVSVKAFHLTGVDSIRQAGEGVRARR